MNRHPRLSHKFSELALPDDDLAGRASVEAIEPPHFNLSAFVTRLTELENLSE